MSVTVQMLASSIINDVYGGLMKPANFSLSSQQVEDSVIEMRNSLLPAALKNGIVTPFSIMQQIGCIDVDCFDMAACCDLQTESFGLRSKEPIPRLLYVEGLKPIYFVGSGDRKIRFKYVDFFQVPHLKYERSTSAAPTVSVDAANYLYLINPPTLAIEVLSLTAAFSNPTELSRYACVCEDKFAASGIPETLADTIKGKLTEGYVRYYKQFSFPQPNTQADLSQVSKR